MCVSNPRVGGEKKKREERKRRRKKGRKKEKRDAYISSPSGFSHTQTPVLTFANLRFVSNQKEVNSGMLRRRQAIAVAKEREYCCI